MRAQVDSDDAVPTITQVFWAGAGSGIVSTCAFGFAESCDKVADQILILSGGSLVL